MTCLMRLVNLRQTLKTGHITVLSNCTPMIALKKNLHFIYILILFSWRKKSLQNNFPPRHGVGQSLVVLEPELPGGCGGGEGIWEAGIRDTFFSGSTARGLVVCTPTEF